MSDLLYPIKFRPIYKDKIWGGLKLKTQLHRNISPLFTCGESWEISGLIDDVSVVSNGFLADNDLNELIEIYMYDLVGEKIYTRFGLGFPLLVKFIDAADALSVQVHPDDRLAMEKYEQNGKTELWHVLDADPGSGVYIGFKNGVDRKKFEQSVREGDIESLLQFHAVKKGDTFLIPAGTVHAIGKGVLLAEIQQASDITFRIFDWNRLDDEGEERELHIEEALDAIHFEDDTEYRLSIEEKNNASVEVIRNPYFNINLLSFDKPIQKMYHTIDSFVIYICTEGEVHFLYDDKVETATKGEVLLKPASMESLNLVPVQPSKLLEIYLDETDEEDTL